MNRRMFLRGVGGATVTIPFLGSLAHANQTVACKRFVAMATQHGGIYGEHMWPDDAMLTETADIGHVIRRGDLTPSYDSGHAVLSQVLTAPDSRLNSGVLSELNLLRGLDVPFYNSHHTGGHLGNFGRHDGERNDPNPLPYRPTIDQVMAWSDGFYGDLDGVVLRSVHAGRDMSWGWSNPISGSGRVELVPPTSSSHALFDSLFAPAGGTGRRLAVDHVMESYQRLRSGAFGPGRRLGNMDRQRLDAHMQRLFELERRLLVAPTCGGAVRPIESTNQHDARAGSSDDMDGVIAYHELWNEVFALALTCGATRILTYNCGHEFEPWAGDWHQQVAHQAASDLDSEQRLVRGHQRFFEHVFLDLCERLDVPDVDGNTVLHNSMLMWVQESGPLTHFSVTLPVITAGSLGGAIRTGQYVDYRDRNNLTIPRPWWTSALQLAQRPGLYYSQFLANILDVMDVSRADWEEPGGLGYGVLQNDNTDAWTPRIEGLANQDLPWFKV